MSVLLLLFVYVIFLFFLTQSLFYMRPWARFPSSPESGLQLWSWLPSNGWLSSLMRLFIHFVISCLLFSFIFTCCFSLCLPLFFLFQLICFKRMVLSGILVLRTSWWFRAQADSLPRLFLGVFHLILRTFLFRCVFMKFITNCQTFLSLFFKKFFFNNSWRNTLSARKFIILVNHILINVKSAKGTVRMRSKTSRKYFA